MKPITMPFSNVARAVTMVTVDNVISESKRNIFKKSILITLDVQVKENVKKLSPFYTISLAVLLFWVKSVATNCQLPIAIQVLILP